MKCQKIQKKKEYIVQNYQQFDNGNIVFDGKPNDLFLDENASAKIDVPDVVRFAKLLDTKGLKLNLEKVTSVDSLLKEVKAVKQNG